MKNLEEWMKAYGISHQNKKNVIIHKVCVPLIMLSVLGLLWCAKLEDIKLLNLAVLLYSCSLIFYLKLGFKVFLLMLIQGGLGLVGVYFLEKTGYLLSISIGTFVLAWIGQFIGHRIEGQKPSFFEDLQFLLIGPIWIFPFFKAR